MALTSPQSTSAAFPSSSTSSCCRALERPLQPTESSDEATSIISSPGALALSDASASPSAPSTSSSCSRATGALPLPLHCASPKSRRRDGSAGAGAKGKSAKWEGNEKGDGPSRNQPLDTRAVALMKTWFAENAENPYLTEELKQYFALYGGISKEQVNSWFANRRNRTNSTHSKRSRLALDERVRQLQEEVNMQKLASDGRALVAGAPSQSQSQPTTPPPLALTDAAQTRLSASASHLSSATCGSQQTCRSQQTLAGVAHSGPGPQLVADNKSGVLQYQPTFAETTNWGTAAFDVGPGLGSHQQRSFMDGLPEPAFLPELMQPPLPFFTYANCPVEGCRILTTDSISGPPMPYTPPLSQQYPLSPTYYPTDGLAGAAGGGHELQQLTPLQTAYASQVELPPPSRCVFASPASSAVSRAESSGLSEQLPPAHLPPLQAQSSASRLPVACVGLQASAQLLGCGPTPALCQTHKLC